MLGIIGFICSVLGALCNGVNMIVNENKRNRKIDDIVSRVEDRF